MTTASSAQLDPITLEVIGSALQSIVEEMGETLIRAAYSTNIKERRDCSTALFDAEGNIIVQAAHVPVHLSSLMGVVGEVMSRYPLSALSDGDVFIGNDPYTGGGSHLPDIVVVSPVFVENTLIGWSANTGHHADFVDRGTKHIFQEGLRIPPVRLYIGGEIQSDVWDLILLNCQVPEERLNDARAQVAANRVGITRLRELCARYSAELFAAAGAELQDYAERQTRAGIAQLPDGTYRFTDTFDCDEFEGELDMVVEVTVDGDEISFDFTGNPGQLPCSVNMIYTALLATVYFSVKTIVDPTILPNSGMYRPIHVEAPRASIVNSESPAAVNQRCQTAQRVVDLIYGALAQAVPAQVTAASNGANSSISLSGVDPRTGKYYVYQETLGGGFGAAHDRDGLDGVQVYMTNTSNLPIESLEQEYPLFVERYELVGDSGGVGKYRGGLAIRRVLRPIDHEAVLKVTTTRRTSRPWGLADGGAGAPSVTVVAEGAVTPAMGICELTSGMPIDMVTPGAGGYGSPADRDRAAIIDDVLEGKVSRAAALAEYGVDEEVLEMAVQA
ncbi:hydantoinase B/oxoprolinase family protein [Nocardia grenadensis]|uniref:hydantoinase B/oxoprolinase family protein n=1 Tax=Nocardia grenadensis TaxID=931537 RepID=UPI0007A49EA4|nr:hydantoinase B/oxoprolinase family protein [Nocardia grenadensis]